MKTTKLEIENAAARLADVYGRYCLLCEAIERELCTFVKAVRLGDKLPPRNEWPDLRLDPQLNSVAAWLDEEGACLKKFRPGSLPEGVVAAGENYLAAEERLVEALEGLERLECLSDTRTREHELWHYMMTPVKGAFSVRTHQALVNEKIAARKQCYFVNKRQVYEAVTRALNAKAPAGNRDEARALRDLRRATMAINRLASEDEVHCWDALKAKVRQKQVLAVWQAAKARRAEHKEVYLHELCAELYVKRAMASQKEQGGYPNFHALYKFCNAHQREF